jgi:hypothetical protein
MDGGSGDGARGAAYLAAVAFLAVSAFLAALTAAGVPKVQQARRLAVDRIGAGDHAVDDFANLRVVHITCGREREGRETET